MRTEPVARTPMNNSVAVGAKTEPHLPNHQRVSAGSGAEVAWLRGTIDKIIIEQRPRVPGWGLLAPHQTVGEYDADKDYLLLVFDHRGHPHTRRFSADEIRQLDANRERAAHQFRDIINSFCADA